MFSSRNNKVGGILTARESFPRLGTSIHDRDERQRCQSQCQQFPRPSASRHAPQCPPGWRRRGKSTPCTCAMHATTKCPRSDSSPGKQGGHVAQRWPVDRQREWRCNSPMRDTKRQIRWTPSLDSARIVSEPDQSDQGLVSTPWSFWMH